MYRIHICISILGIFVFSGLAFAQDSMPAFEFEGQFYSSWEIQSETAVVRFTDLHCRLDPHVDTLVCFRTEAEQMAQIQLPSPAQVSNSWCWSVFIPKGTPYNLGNYADPFPTVCWFRPTVNLTRDRQGRYPSIASYKQKGRGGTKFYYANGSGSTYLSRSVRRVFMPRIKKYKWLGGAV